MQITIAIANNKLEQKTKEVNKFSNELKIS